MIDSSKDRATKGGHFVRAALLFTSVVSSSCTRDALDGTITGWPPPSDLAGPEVEWDLARPPVVDLAPPADLSRYGCLFVSPEQMDFGMILVGNPSPPYNLTLTNLCDTPVAISALSVSGPGAGDFAHDAPQPPITLAPRAWRVITVAFQPKRDRGLREATLRISSDDARNPIFEVLMRGVAAP